MTGEANVRQMRSLAQEYTISIQSTNDEKGLRASITQCLQLLEHAKMLENRVTNKFDSVHRFSHVLEKQDIEKDLQSFKKQKLDPYFDETFNLFCGVYLSTRDKMTQLGIDVEEYDKTFYSMLIGEVNKERIN